LCGLYARLDLDPRVRPAMAKCRAKLTGTL
jgi:hypothetical protein